MSRLRKSILGAALLTGSATAACVMPMHSAEARPVWGPHHWVHGWHGGRFGWWWAGPDVWYWYPPAPVYYDYPPPADFVVPPRPTWYYCDGAHGYYPYVRSCPSGWRAVPTTPEDQSARDTAKS